MIAAFAAESIALAAVPLFVILVSIATVALFNSAERAEAKPAKLIRVAARCCGDAHRGRITELGCRFDPDRMIAAMRGVRIGARVRVYRADGCSVEVTIADSRAATVEPGEIALAEAAFLQLAPRGVRRLSVEVHVID